MMVPDNLFRLLWSVIFLVSVVKVHSTGNMGRCPRGMLDKKLCRGQLDQCQSDVDCGGESLCCSTGCNRICTLPAFTACDHSRYFYEKQVKLLKAEEAKGVLIPKCTESGAFEEIQCNGNSGICWCVDSFGFEKGGTRGNSRETVNCTRSNDRCAGPQCRMLCPYGFELDSDGCEMCVCKDICKGVKCPGSLECQLQEVSCATEPCPPVPTCKKARTLESLCPIGVPFTIPENGNPFLCGNRPGKPTCPTGFICNVAAGDDYGICCGSDAFYEKPGLCPTVSSAGSHCDDSSSSAESQCQSSCKHDLECPEMTKCCMTESRGKQCSQALNSTMCLQQKKIAEILSTKEIEGRGYIPQCDSNGHFLMKQCSRNGKICWCVDGTGRNIPQSLAPAEFVDCTNTPPQAAQMRRDLVDGDSRSEACDINLCGNTCEFGYNTDEVTGCGSCDCNVDPCSTLNCPVGSKCSFAALNDCPGSKLCRVQPICIPNVLHVNPCDNGTPLFDHSSNQLVICSENRATCPSSHVCVKASVNTDGLCCLNLPRLEPTKPGMCPFISSSICNNGTLESNNKQCSSDNGCEGDMKCCALPCGAICADPLLDAQTESNKLPTMCQYLETVELKQNDVLKNFKMAMEIPKCKSSGDFDEIQCNEHWCFCADEFGMEINSTRVSKAESNLTSAYCLEQRQMPTCLDMTCRLGCDYGYKTKDKCRICECVNPCEQNSLCDDDHYCEMVDMDCSDGYCPAIPYCIPRLYAAITMSQQMAKENGLCPNGFPYFDAEMNETLTCRPRARMLQCPDDYFCHETKENGDFGYCCPIIELADESSSIIGKGEDSIPVISSGNILDEFPEHRTETLTDCELARERQMETVLENHRVNYIPRCHPATGNWEPIQCIEEVNMCWCVNNNGVRTTGSMTSGKPTCNSRQSRGGKFLGSTSKSEQAVCSDGESVHVCNKSSCEDRICMAYPDASCGIDPCGGCRVKFYDENNNVVDCTAGLGKCHKAAQTIMNSRAWINQQKQSGNSGDSEFGGSIEHMIEDVLQERLGRGVAGSSPFPTMGELVSQAMKQSESSFEQFGEKVAEFFLRNGSPSSQRGAGRSLFGSSGFSESLGGAATTSAFSTAAMPMTMRKASCPHPTADEILFRLTGTCVDLCNYDDECGHDERCCLIDCGYRCKNVAMELQVQVVERSKGVSGLESPATDDFEESNMLLNPPACSGNGDFEFRQSQGDLSWCVDNEGRPHPESFTRGHVVCSEQGKLIEKRSTGHICPNSDTQPMICTDQCMHSACKGHPDAICVADPCDACKVSFFTSSGEKVLCEEKCQQKVDPGLCRASFARYFYNVTSRQCEEFFWGGCQGNDNNFESLAECQDECNREVDICGLPVATGPCHEKVERWYFDLETDACQKFLGCDVKGGNNFPSKRHCESQCPIRVLCPNLVEGGLSVCNRAEACHNLTSGCQGLNTDNFLCIVDPCSCTAELQNLDGNGIQCPEIKTTALPDMKERLAESKPAGTSSETDAEISTLPTRIGSLRVDPSVVPRVEDRDPLTGSALLVRQGFTTIKSRCLNMREKYFSKCDDLGQFVPTQCSADEPVCWCVDSIGNQLEGTATFLAGSTTCPSVAIQKVNVRLSFPVSSAEDVSASQLGTEVQDLLRSLNAELEDNKVSVENVEGYMNVEFALEGQSSGKISYMLEEGLRRNLLGISVQDQFTLADLSTSRFHYVVPEVSEGEYEGDVTTLPSEESSEVKRVDEVKINDNFVVGWDDGSVTAKEVNQTSQDLNVEAIVLTVIAAITAVLIIIGLLLGLQNKKKMANDSKHKFSSKPFSSPFVLETETKCKI